MSPGQIAALVAAGAFVLLVGLLAIVADQGGAVPSTRRRSRCARRATNTDPLFTEANTTLTHVNTQLERVDGITANARAVTSNVSALTSCSPPPWAGRWSRRRRCPTA